MGLVKNNLEFDFPAPKPEIIIEKISEISGLPVSIISSHEDELHDLHITIAFDAFPEDTLEIYTYRPGAIKEFDKEITEEGYDPNWPIPIEGSDEKEGKQNVYLSGYVGQELTLYFAAKKALKALGGVSSEIISTEDNCYKFPIAIEELKVRHLRLKRQIQMHWIMIVILLPILIPFYALKAIYGFIKMPFDIRKAYKMVKERYPRNE